MTEHLSVVLVDDEPLARDALRIRLSAEPGFDIVGEAGGGREAIALVRALDPDVLFLDVQMPDVNGFDALREVLKTHTPLVVFVTAHDAFALRAFDHNAVDYLLKPFTTARLRASLTRVRAMAAARASADVAQRLQSLLAEVGHTAAVAPASSASSVPQGLPPHGRFSIRDGDRFVLVDPREVVWFEAEANYVRLHLPDAMYRMRGPMRLIESQLPARGFARIHRGTIVNVAHIKEIHPRTDGDFDVTLRHGKVLRLSRHYRDRILQ